jgi:hypothetical protein
LDEILEIRDVCTSRLGKDKSGADKYYYTRIGSAFFKSEDRINIQLDALPVNGSLILFKKTPKEQQPENPPF